MGLLGSFSVIKFVKCFVYGKFVFRGRGDEDDDGCSYVVLIILRRRYL